jgi:hypothetical protein
MATRRINKLTVDCLFCPPGNRDVVWDDKLKGFGVIVYPTRLKTHVAQCAPGAIPGEERGLANVLLGASYATVASRDPSLSCSFLYDAKGLRSTSGVRAASGRS